MPSTENRPENEPSRWRIVSVIIAVLNLTINAYRAFGKALRSCLPGLDWLPDLA